MMNKSTATVAACCLATCVLGSIHAFSVLLQPIESELGVTRSESSLIYSLALVMLTTCVFFGYRLYCLLEPMYMIALSLAGSAAGLLVAILGGNWSSLLIGYSVLFGSFNGLGYGFALQLAARAAPSHSGFAMGMVTAAYAVGATIFARVFSVIVESRSYTDAFLVLAVTLIGLAIICAALLPRGVMRYSRPVDNSEDSAYISFALILRLWWGYGLAVFAGLMAIGHATGIAYVSGASAGNVVLAAMLIVFGNAIGGVAAGVLADRTEPRWLLFGLSVLTAGSLGVMLMSRVPAIVICGLALVGFAYGAIIAVYPFAVRYYVGATLSAKAYGRVFTAWGFSGLVAPWLAGFLFDRTQDYAIALAIAAALAAISALIVFTFPRTAAA